MVEPETLLFRITISVKNLARGKNRAGKVVSLYKYLDSNTGNSEDMVNVNKVNFRDRSVAHDCFMKYLLHIISGKI